MNQTESKKNKKSEKSPQHLKSIREMAIYLEACLMNPDADVSAISRALGEIARTIGMPNIASATGLTRENLYKTFSGERNPPLGTFLKLIKAAGLRLRVEEAEPSRHTRRRKLFRELSINDAHIRFTSISAHKFNSLCSRGYQFYKDTIPGSSIKNLIRREEPWFDQAKLYASLSSNFGESIESFDRRRCSFQFHFLFRVKAKGKAVTYVSSFNDSRSDFEMVFWRIAHPHPDSCDEDSRIISINSEEEFDLETMLQFTGWFIAFLMGYMSVCQHTWHQDFVRYHKYRRLIYGFRNGSFFEDYYEDEESFAAARKTTEIAITRPTKSK